MEPETFELLMRTVRAWVIWAVLFVSSTLALNAISSWLH